MNNAHFHIVNNIIKYIAITLGGSMRIGIDARGLSWYKGTGIGTYTESLINAMLNLNDYDNYYLLYWYGTEYKNYINKNTRLVLSSRKHHSFFEQVYIPKILERDNIDLYHIPQNGIGFSNEIPCSTVVTIHDLIPYTMPETVGRGYLLKFLKDMPSIIENSKAIITVSDWSKKDILRLFPIDESKIYVTHLAADPKYKILDKDFCKNYIKSTYKIDKPFVLYLGGFSPRKNVDSLIKAFNNINKRLCKEYNLVIAGEGKDDFNKLKELSLSLKSRDKIKFTGYLKNEDLPLFYNACDAFIYPSFYEGFGLPVLEAMNCGCPVITSNVSSIPEVVGNAGIMINPSNINELEDAMEMLLNDETLKEKYSLLGLQRSSEFSWEKTAKLTLNVYNIICNS